MLTFGRSPILRANLFNIVAHLYVDGARGNDLNRGTLAAPLKTVAGVRAHLPFLARNPIFVHFASGLYDWDAPLGPMALRANVYFIGDGAGVQGDDGFATVLGSTAMAAGSTNKSIVGSALTINAYHGKTLEILSGNAAGDRRSIRNNTATAIVPSSALSAAPATNDTFRVVAPAVRFKVPSGLSGTTTPVTTAIVGMGGGGSRPVQQRNITAAPALYLINIALEVSTPLSFSIWEIVNSNVVMLGVEVRRTISTALGVFTSDYQSGIMAGYDALAEQTTKVIGPYVDGLVGSVTRWRGWGLTNPLSSSQCLLQPSRFTGVMCAQNNIIIGGEWWLIGGSFICTTNGITTLDIRGSAHVGFGEYTGSVAVPFYIANSSSTDARISALKVQDWAFANLFNALIEKTNVGTAVQAVGTGDHDSAGPGTVAIDGDTGLVTVTGITASNAPSYGLAVRGGGRLNFINGYLTMSGWTAGTQAAVFSQRLNQTPDVAQDLTAFAADGDSIAALDGSRIQRL